MLKCVASDYEMAQLGSACDDGECMHCIYMVCPEEEEYYEKADYQHDIAREG